MFGNFFNNFGHFLHPSHPNAPPPQHQPPAKAPPASQKAISNLPMVKVTADDILEVTNKECLICLEEQKIGAWACKLQCGHLFHRQCLVEWLEKHCTCPVCRFELETDDQSYEAERKKRMKKRKLRLRKDEINNKNLSQLRELAVTLNVNIAGCLDKQDVIERLVQSGHIEVTEGLPPMEMDESAFLALKVGELKHLLLSFGLPDRDLIEKSELRDKLLNSGRVVIKPDSKPPAHESDGDTHMAVDGSTSYPGRDMADHRTTNPPSSSSSGHVEPSLEHASSSGKYLTLLSDLQACSISEIRDLCARYHVDTAGCLDKQELVSRLATSPHVHILPTDGQLSAGADHLSTDSNEAEVSRNASPSRPPYSNLYDTVPSAQSTKSNAYDTLPSAPSTRSNAYDTLPSAQSSTHGGSTRVNAYDSLPSAPSSSHGSSRRYGDNSADPPRHAQGQEQADASDHRMALSDSLLADMSVREVKSIMQAFNVDSTGCIEKGEMVQRLRNSGHVRWVAD
jgi:hypothetical protein